MCVEIELKFKSQRCFDIFTNRLRYLHCLKSKLKLNEIENTMP